MSDLQKKLSQIRELPTLPDVVATLNQMVRDPNTSAANINDVISRDVSLSAKVLKLVNSPFYGFPRRITTITYAVVILGFNTIRNLALSAFIFDAFTKGQKRDFDLAAFWKHSLATAVAAQAVAQKSGLGLAEDAFMGGLLHDIGKVIMSQHFIDDFTRIVKTIKQEDCLFLNAEERLLDYNHCEVGGLLLERWNLPEHVVKMVRFHHAPTSPVLTHEDPRDMLCDIVHTGDILARSLACGSGGDDKIPALSPVTWERLGLDWPRAGEIMDNILKEMQQAESFLEA